MSVLREITADLHREAEDTPFVQYMYSGNITVRDYGVYLRQIQKVYSELEYFGKVSGMTLDLPDLNRTGYIREDLAELGEDKYVAAIPSVTNYIQRLYQLYHSGNRDKLMAHIYVRHMGDLFGGKMIAKKVPGSGKYYQFSDRPELVKRLSEKITMDLAEEAKFAFKMSTQIFNEIQELMENVNDKKST
jgi:heme oxygenase